LSLALGLVLGIGAAYLLQLHDDRVRTPEDVQAVTGLSTLGILPVASNGDFYAELDNPQSAISEAYRSLATALQLTSASGLPRSIAVTSAGAGEGKSSTALAIARHFATMGQKVLLIDGDMRKPSLHEKLGQDNAAGFSIYLTGTATLQEVIHDTTYPNLALMSSGPLPPNAADILGGTQIFSLVSISLEKYDVIVIDSPPLLGLADAQLLSSAASATLFVVAVGQHRKGMIRSGIRRLQLARSSTMGVVLTKFDVGTSGYGYGYGYGPDGYSYGSTLVNGLNSDDHAQITNRAET